MMFSKNQTSNQTAVSSDLDALGKIKKQLEAAGVKDLFGTKKEVKALPEILEDEEIIKYATSGFVDGNTVLIVLTQKRLLFIDKGMFYGIKSTEIPLDMVNGVSYQKKLLLGTISVTNGANTVKIENVAKDTCPIMAEKIKTAADKYKKSMRNTETTNNVSSVPIAEEIKALKQLVDDGILTEEEFSAKKRQLLNI